MTTVRRYYDVVVIGQSLGTLTAGVLLARRGFRVALVRGDELPNAYKYKQFTLYRSLNNITLFDTPVFERVTSELAIGPVVRRKILSPEVKFQVVLPTHRIDARTPPEALKTELEREFPEVANAMDDFYNIVRQVKSQTDRLLTTENIWPPTGFFERRAIHKLTAQSHINRDGSMLDPLREFPQDHPFRTFVLAQTRFVGSGDPDTMTNWPMLRAHGHALGHGEYFDGGRDALQSLLQERIVLHGGDDLTREKAAKIHVERGRVKGVDLAQIDERLGCAFVIASYDEGRALYLSSHTPSRKTSERLLARAARYYEFTVNLVVNAHAVPVGMARRVYVVNDRTRPLAEENLLCIETAEPDANGHVVLTVQALLPRSGVEEGETYLIWQRKRILNVIRELIPFLDQHLLVVDSPHDGLALHDHQTDKDDVVADRWNGEAERMRTKDARPADGFMGVCGQPLQTEIKGLFLPGRQVIPSFGDEGEMLVGYHTARMITKTDPSKEQMRHDVWSKST